MKNILITSFTALSLMISSAVFAETAPVVKPAVKPVAKPAVVKAEKKSEKKPVATTVNLYESPEANSKVISKLPANADLVAIYHQGDWIKVGDRQNGLTGWINIAQYHQAKRDFYRQYFHTNISNVYINTFKDKDGKTVIEAYRNGKKLSEVDAKKLYAQMQSQEQHQWQAMQHFNHVMDQQMQMDYLNARRAMDSAFQMMPGIVIVEKPAAQVAQNKAEKNKK